MSEVHPMNRVLLSVLDNQAARTAAAFEGLREDVFSREPGGDCNSILKIGRHLVNLRRFQLVLMESPLAGKVNAADGITTIEQLLSSLKDATELVRQAISQYDAAQWYAVPPRPREGKWGDEPTMLRLVRPLNDFTNHLGAVRAIRRMLGNACERTQ
jgi:hypothetical protein